MDLKRFWMSGWCLGCDSRDRATAGRLLVAGLCAEERKRWHCCVGDDCCRFRKRALEGAIERDMLCEVLLVLVMVNLVMDSSQTNLEFLELLSWTVFPTIQAKACRDLCSKHRPLAASPLLRFSKCPVPGPCCGASMEPIRFTPRLVPPGHVQERLMIRTGTFHHQATLEVRACFRLLLVQLWILSR